MLLLLHYIAHHRFNYSWSCVKIWNQYFISCSCVLKFIKIFIKVKYVFKQQQFEYLLVNPTYICTLIIHESLALGLIALVTWFPWCVSDWYHNILPEQDTDSLQGSLIYSWVGWSNMKWSVFLKSTTGLGIKTTILWS